MHTIKQILTSITLASLIAVPLAQAYPSTTVIVPEIKLSDNPPSLLVTAGYVGVFLVAAYVLKNMFQPVPVIEMVQKKSETLEKAPAKGNVHSVVTVRAKKN